MERLVILNDICSYEGNTMHYLRRYFLFLFLKIYREKNLFSFVFVFVGICSRKKLEFLFGAWFNLTARFAEHFHPMICPIQPEPYFLAAPKIEESPRISLSLRNPQRERTSLRQFLNSSNSINHYEESHLFDGPFGSILLDQGILVKNKLDDTL